jgi:hypothetical protein
VDKRPLGVGFVFLSVALALAAMLLTGCGGSDDRTKVEASLRHYISGMHPEEGAFPIDAGPPRVRGNGCKDRHVTTNGGLYEFHNAGMYLPAGLTLWSCVVTFRNSLTLPVDVVVKGSEVVAVFPGASPNAPRQPPATVYEGAP